jgi:hypothetical protein
MSRGMVSKKWDCKWPIYRSFILDSLTGSCPVRDQLEGHTWQTRSSNLCNSWKLRARFSVPSACNICPSAHVFPLAPDKRVVLCFPENHVVLCNKILTLQNAIWRFRRCSSLGLFVFLQWHFQWAKVGKENYISKCRLTWLLKQMVHTVTIRF